MSKKTTKNIVGMPIMLFVISVGLMFVGMVLGNMFYSHFIISDQTQTTRICTNKMCIDGLVYDYSCDTHGNVIAFLHEENNVPTKCIIFKEKMK